MVPFYHPWVPPPCTLPATVLSAAVPAAAVWEVKRVVGLKKSVKIRVHMTLAGPF